jgi:hypothetical protein
MTLPRWLVVSLMTVSALATLAAGAWWWVTWPERTASQFCELVHDLRFDDASRMCSTNLIPVLDSCARNPDGWDVHADMHSTRILRDVLLGRHRTDLFVGTSDRAVTLLLAAERGKIVFAPNE